MNEDSISGMTSTIVNTTTDLTSLTIDWNTDDEVFVTDEMIATMPGFETISLVYGGLDYPAEEAIEVGYDGADSAVLAIFPLKDSVEDIYVYKSKFISEYFYTVSNKYIKVSTLLDVEEILYSSDRQVMPDVYDGISTLIFAVWLHSSKPATFTFLP